jgi:hypothetical protein
MVAGLDYVVLLKGARRRRAMLMTTSAARLPTAPLHTTRLHDTKNLSIFENNVRALLLFSSYFPFAFLQGCIYFPKMIFPPPLFELYIFSPFRDIMRDVKFDVVIP